MKIDHVTVSVAGLVNPLRLSSTRHKLQRINYCPSEVAKEINSPPSQSTGSISQLHSLCIPDSFTGILRPARTILFSASSSDACHRAVCTDTERRMTHGQLSYWSLICSGTPLIRILMDTHGILHLSPRRLLLPMETFGEMGVQGLCVCFLLSYVSRTQIEIVTKIHIHVLYTYFRHRQIRLYC